MGETGKFEIRHPKLEVQFFLFFLASVLLFAGCAQLGILRPSNPHGDEVEKTPTEEEKARLLKQIERKFENPEAHFALGQLYQLEGMWSQAEHRYNTTLSFSPVHREAQAALVKVLIASGDAEKAQVTADIYINQVGGSAAESLRLGLAFQKQGLDDYALSCYHQALRLAPSSAKINRQIGYYYLSKGNKLQAQDYLSRSFQLNPNQPEVAGELGRLGVVVRIPRKTTKETKRLDKIVEQSDQQ